MHGERGTKGIRGTKGSRGKRGMRGAIGLRGVQGRPAVTSRCMRIFIVGMLLKFITPNLTDSLYTNNPTSQNTVEIMIWVLGPLYIPTQASTNPNFLNPNGTVGRNSV
jgi:hypothetical protein